MNALEEPTGTILIVDDEPQNVQVVGMMLDSFGYDFMVARDGEEALISVRISSAVFRKCLRKASRQQR